MYNRRGKSELFYLLIGQRRPSIVRARLYTRGKPHAHTPAHNNTERKNVPAYVCRLDTRRCSWWVGMLRGFGRERSSGGGDRFVYRGHSGGRVMR